MSGARVPGGVVHDLPVDLRTALLANRTALDAWNDITPLARNEFICWVEDHHARLLGLLDRPQLRETLTTETIPDPQRELHSMRAKRCRSTRWRRGCCTSACRASANSWA